MTVSEAYFWMTILLCIGVFQNSLGDLLIVKKHSTITSFKIAFQPFVSKYARWHRVFYESPGAWWSKICMILSAVAGIGLTLMHLNPAIPLTLVLFLQILTYPRWRLFVSSDSPLLRAILFTLILHYLFSKNEVIADLGIFFISAYLGLIYFFTGIQKLMSQSWRSGLAMIHFANKSSFWARSGLANSTNWFLKTTAWGVIFFELCFLLGSLHPKVAIAFMIMGFLFHGALSFSMGINHFFWTFLACYPAYLYVSGKILW